MKRVINDLLQEIDYLGALAEMYRGGGEVEAQMAALEARSALERLVNVILHSKEKAAPELPAAA
jgi:hypothetical protein